MADPRPWAFLAPWWRILQAHRLTWIRSRRGLREELHALCVSIYPRLSLDQAAVNGPPARKASTQLRDALELVFLLACVDRRGFEQFVWEIVHSHSPADASGEFDTHPDGVLSHVELRVDCVPPNETPEVAHAALCFFLTPQRIDDRDPAFQVARQQIIERVAPGNRGACDYLSISILLSRCPFKSRQPDFMSPLEFMRVVENAEAAAASRQDSAYQYPFVASRVWLNCDLSIFTPETTTQINAWHARGSTLPFNRVGNISLSKTRSRLQLGEALSAVFRSERSAGQADFAYDHVCISDLADRERLGQVCSILMQCRCIRSLTVSVDTHERIRASPLYRRFRLRLLMFTLFSRWATHNIQQVDLQGIYFSEEDLDDINQLLTSENPLPSIFGDVAFPDGGGTASPAKQVLAMKNAVLRFGSRSKINDRTGKRTFFTLSQETWLDVVGEHPRDWVVLVPAYGKCRLRRDSVIQERGTPMSSSGTRVITSLQFDAPDFGRGPGTFSLFSMPPHRNPQSIFSVYERLGPHLEALTARNATAQHADALVALLASCPSLKRLHLPYMCPRLLPHLVQAYETGACKATSLDLRWMEEGDDDLTTTQFYDTLARPTRRIASNVRELAISFQGRPLPMDEQIRKVLENNSVLEYFERKFFRGQHEPNAALYHDFNNTTIAITPVTPSCKAAFLSVASSDVTLAPTAAQLDSIMISRIFDMAATRVVRKVHGGCAV